jgi:broad specificity phosphatase PhoE
MTRFLLIRHAAHDLLGNSLTGRMRGVVLNNDGRRQAQQLAARLAREDIAIVQSSPLERALQTAEPIAESLRTAVQIAPAMNEVDFGEWSGRSFRELDLDPRWERWNSVRSLTRAPQGESIADVQNRVLKHLQNVHVSEPGGTVAIVSHAEVIRAALLYFLGLPAEAYSKIEIGPASVSRLLLGNRDVRVVSLNEGGTP